MKKAILALILLACVSQLVMAFPRKVLVEEVTSWTCGPCASSSGVFNAWLEDHEDQIAVVVYHANWPGAGNDPFYLANPSQNAARFGYYGVTGVPACFFEGTEAVAPGSALDLNNTFSELITVESPVQLEVTYQFQGNQLVVQAAASTGDDAVNGSNLFIRSALVEEYTYMPDAPNGQDDWHYGMINMQPDASGTAFSLDANSSNTFEFTYDWDASYDPDNYRITIWIQDDNNRDVIQAEMVEILPHYMIVVSSDYESHITDTNSEAVFTESILNRGSEDDTYTIHIDSDLPDGWSWYFTTPDGNQTTDYNVDLGSMETFDFELHVATGNVQSEQGTITLNVSSNEETTNIWTETKTLLTMPHVLVINDDPEGAYSEYYSAVLEASDVVPGLTYAVWETSELVVPINDINVSSYLQAVLWFNGDGGVLDANVIEQVGLFQENGGGVFVNGNTMPQKLSGSDLLVAMGATFNNVYEADAEINGVSGTAIGDNLTLAVTGGDGAGNTVNPSTMTLSNGAEACFLYDNSPFRRAAVSNEPETGGKTIIFGFPFEAISSLENRQAVMDRVITFLNPSTDVDDGGVAFTQPLQFNLCQNYPNPFNPETEIRFTLPASEQVTLSVYNTLGRQITTLVSQKLSSGDHRVVFNGSTLTSGIYFYRLETPSHQMVKKMILLK